MAQPAPIEQLGGALPQFTAQTLRHRSQSVATKLRRSGKGRSCGEGRQRGRGCAVNRQFEADAPAAPYVVNDDRKLGEIQLIAGRRTVGTR